MTADERINALLERAGCPVMVVKSDAPPTPERHMADLIDRLEVALENALNERDFAADTVRHIVALDVVPVTRCKDCRHSAPLDGYAKYRFSNRLNCMNNRGDSGYGITNLSLIYPDGYCDDGERMDGDADGTHTES